MPGPRLDRAISHRNKRNRCRPAWRPGHPRARAAEGARRQRQAATWNCLTCKATLDSAPPTINLLRMSQTAELQRRVLLAESDILLDDVEALRLLDLVEAPPRLREAI